MPNAGTVTVLLRGDLAGLEKALDRAEARLEKTGGRLQQIGTRLSAGLSVAIAGIGIAAGASAISFEQAMAGVAKTVDASEAEVAALGDEFTRLSETIPVARSELAGIGEEAGQLGVAKRDILGFTRTVADLRVATDLGQDAGNALARLANIMGRRANPEFQRMGSTIVALGNDGASTEREIADMALRIAGAGKQVNLSTAQVLAFAGALSSVGIESEAGGTAISRVFADIASAVASGGERLDAFAQIAGMSSEGFRAAFEKDAAGAVVTFIEGLGRLSAAGENVFGVLEAVEFADIRVRDALLRAAGAGDLLRSQLDLGARAWQENTALTREAERFYVTSGNQLKVLRNRLSNMAGELGTAVVPALLAAVEAGEPVLDLTRAMIQAFTDMPRPVQTLVVAMGALTAALGPLTFALGVATSGLSALSGGAASAVAGLVALKGLVGVGGLVLSIRSFADATTLARWALAGLGSMVTPGGVLLVGLGLLATLWMRNRLEAQAAAREFAAAQRKISESVAKMTEDQARAALVQSGSAMQATEARLAEVRKQIAAERQRLDERPAFEGRHATTQQGSKRLRLLEAEAEQLERTAELHRLAATEAAKRLDTTIRMRQAREAADDALKAGAGFQIAETDPIAEAHERLATALRTAEGMERLLGGAFDQNAARASAYRAALQALLAEGVDPTSQDVRDLAAALTQAEAALEAEAEATRLAAEAKRAHDALVQQGVSLFHRTITAQQLYEQRVRALDAALKSGALTQQEYGQALAGVERDLADATRSIADTLREEGVAAGESLVRGILSGSRDMGELLKSAFINLALTYIMGPIKGVLGIASPSKVFQGYGEAIGDGLALGIRSRIGAVQSATAALTAATHVSAFGSAAARATVLAPGATAPGAAATVTVHVPSPPPAADPISASRDATWIRLMSETMRELEAAGAIRLGTVG